MLGASDIGGLMAMMPAFATDDAADITRHRQSTSADFTTCVNRWYKICAKYRTLVRGVGGRKRI
jgi:hypothetical protein